MEAFLKALNQFKSALGTTRSSSPPAEAAVISLLASMQRFDRVVKMYKRLPQLFCSPQSRVSVAVSLSGLNRLDEACRLLEDIVLEYTESARIYHYLGEFYLSRGDYGSARRAYEHVIRMDPRDASAYNGLGLACALMGALTDAERYLKHALKLLPNESVISRNITVLLRVKRKKKRVGA